MSKISHNDIASKLREIQQEVDTEAEAAKPAGLAVAGTAVAVAVGLAFVIGQRKARKLTTVVEVRRV